MHTAEKLYYYIHLYILYVHIFYYFLRFPVSVWRKRAVVSEQDGNLGPRLPFSKIKWILMLLFASDQNIFAKLS